MNANEKVNIQDGYTLQQVLDLNPLRKQILEYLIIMHENCKKDKEYSVNLTRVLQKEFKLSSAAAIAITTKAVKIGLMYRLGPKNHYMRFNDDHAVPNEKMLDRLCKIKRRVKVQAHKSVEALDNFEVIVKSDFNEADNACPNNNTEADQQVITAFMHSDIYKSLKDQGFDIKLSKTISYNI